MDYTSIIIAVFGGIITGGIGLELVKGLINRRRNAAQTVGEETDSFTKLQKLIEDTLEKNAKLANDNLQKDAVIANNEQQIQTLKLMLEVANGTINKNNEFMKEVLIGWGEMKKSEEICQKKVGELEARVNQIEQQQITA